jgi:hypothetical protein
LVSAPLKTLDLSKNGIGAPDGWAIKYDDWGRVEGYTHSDGRTQKQRPEGVSSGVIALVEALVNAPLTNLDIGRNDIGVEGAKAIAAVLPQVR